MRKPGRIFNLYHRNRMKRFISILILLAEFLVVNGQKPQSDGIYLQDIRQIIKIAEGYFEDGRFDKCISVLDEAMKRSSLKRDEKERILELLANAYVETDDMQMADATVNLLLVNFPHYEADKSSNSEGFIRLVKKYRIHPLISIAARNTGDWFRFKTTKVYSVLNGLDYSVPYNGPQSFVFMYYGNLEYEFVPNLSVNVEGLFYLLSYSRSLSSPPGFSLYFSEATNYIEMLVYFKKYFDISKNMIFYGAAGVGYNLIFRSKGYVSISYTKDDLITGKNQDFSASEGNIDLMSMRNPNNFEWIAGVGIGYRIKNLRMYIDTKYYGGLTSFTNPEKMKQNNNLSDTFFYIDNSVKVNQFEIGVTISYTLFNSVKRIKE